MNDIYIIAEIGINHNGSLQIAKELIDMAKECGCNAVKFQKRTISIVYSEEILNQCRESPWGSTQRDQKEGLELSIDQYDEINSYCKLHKIEWFASSWDIPSQKLMRRYQFPHNKIASAMATNLDFVTEVASEKIHTFVSTGMMKIQDIDEIVDIFKVKRCEYTLLHTVSTYPSEESDLNLSCINTLKDRYKCDVGYSGHETTVSPSIVAASIGATVIERHITLDRSMYGSDQSSSLQKEGLRTLVNSIRKLPIIMGDGKKRIIKKEVEISNKLRYWNNQ